MRIFYLIVFVFLLASCGHNEELTLDCSLAPIDLKVGKVVATDCGVNIGEIHVEALGGNGGYMYSLDGTNFQAEAIFTSLSAGQYTVYVTDKGDCAAQVNATVLDNGNVSISTPVSTQNADCGVSNGSLTVAATGGDGVYLYSLDGGIPQAEPLFSQLNAGTYTVTVEDGSGCVAISTAVIANNNGIIVDNVDKTDAGCGTTLGGITINVSGGDGTYSYSIDGTTFQASNSFTGLSNSIYMVSIKDNSGCTTSVDVSVLSGVSFQQQVKAIIDGNCATANCHVGRGRTDLTQWSVIQANSEDIKSRILSGNMPKTGTLTQNEIDLIVCWIDDGAINN